ncbi:MAG: TRIC cation channel family protein [Sphingomonas sp.]|nr:TRIC cation channel family protein [Sphingomonas sp.]
MALTSIQLIDYAGMGFLAASGAIAAAERREDAVTFIFFGCFTGMGGGTLRDLLIGAPVFWVTRPDYLVVSVLASLAVWISPMRWTSHKALLWLDAVGLAAYAVVGTSKAYGFGLSPPVCVASVDVLLLMAGFGIMGAAVIGGLVGFVLRAGTLLWDWRLPRFKPN